MMSSQGVVSVRGGIWRKQMRSIGSGNDWPLPRYDPPSLRTRVSGGRFCRSRSMSWPCLDSSWKCDRCGCTYSMRCYWIRDHWRLLDNCAPSDQPYCSWNRSDYPAGSNPLRCGRCHCSDSNAQTLRDRHGRSDRIDCIWSIFHDYFRVSCHGRHHRRRHRHLHHHHSQKCSRGQNGPDGCTCSTRKPWTFWCVSYVPYQLTSLYQQSKQLLN